MVTLLDLVVRDMYILPDINQLELAKRSKGKPAGHPRKADSIRQSHGAIKSDMPTKAPIPILKIENRALDRKIYKII